MKNKCLRFESPKLYFLLRFNRNDIEIEKHLISHNYICIGKDTNLPPTLKQIR